MIKIEKLTKTFGDHILFKGLTMEIKDGEFVVFSGASGCGKTTLLNLIGAIEKADSGRIIVDNFDLTNKFNKLEYFRTKVGFLFQNFALSENKTVRQNLEMVKNSCRTNMSIETALDKVGVLGKIDSYVYTLSGGEQQRVALARLMIKKCDIILADEPTGSLDKANGKVVTDILKELNSEYNKTIIMVTHDESLKSIGTRIINLD